MFRARRAHHQERQIVSIQFLATVTLNVKFHRMYWIIGRKSELSLENKLLIYKTILKPIWT